MSPLSRDHRVPSADRRWDVVVVGSGFGGMMVACPLVRAGLRVLMLEQGGWIEAGAHHRAWDVDWHDRPGFSRDAPYAVEGESRKSMGSFECVGGASVFYGGVALRFRARDFGGYREVSGDVRWPLDYGEIGPWYDLAERLLGVSGDERGDATAPPRTRALPPPVRPLSPTSRSLAGAARRVGLHPVRLPLAIDGRRPCAPCGACDGFPCEGKNDLASRVLPELLERGLTLRTNTVVAGLEHADGRIVAAHARDRVTGERLRFRGSRFVVAGGALATPHLLLASGLHGRSPAGDAVGRHLMRHCNGIVLGAAPSAVGREHHAMKQLGIHDLYFGDPGQDDCRGKLGAIQQIRAMRIALSMPRLPAPLRAALYPAASRLVGFIVMAEDQPRRRNRVWLDGSRRDRYGRPVPRVHHEHTERDRRARRVLTRKGAEVLREAGAAFTFTVPVRTFSHACGTVRMGDDPKRFPVARDGRYRGVENLWITDASVFPTSGAVNPSLTIAANALRIGAGMVGGPADPPRVRPSWNRGRRPTLASAEAVKQ